MKKAVSVLLAVLILMCTFGCGKEQNNVDSSADNELLNKKLRSAESTEVEPGRTGLLKDQMIDWVSAASSKLKKIGLSDIFSYKLIDLDFDGVPELMVKGSRNNDSLYPISFYKFENGNMEELDCSAEPQPGNSRLYLYYDITAKKPVYVSIYRYLKALNAYSITLSEFTLNGASVNENILTAADYDHVGANSDDSIKYTVSGSEKSVSSKEYCAYIADYMKDKINLNLTSAEEIIANSNNSMTKIKDKLADLYLNYFYKTISDAYGTDNTWIPSFKNFIEKNDGKNTGWILFDIDGNSIPELYFYNSDGTEAPVYALNGTDISEIDKISAEKLYISFDYKTNKDILIGYTSTSDSNFIAVVYSLKDGKLSPADTYEKVGDIYSINGEAATKSAISEFLELYIDESNLASTVTEYSVDAANTGITEYMFRDLIL